jgi:carbon-monoxide dehydrogenase catalytic subunit
MAKLSKEDIEGLKEMVGAFKALKNLTSGIGAPAAAAPAAAPAAAVARPVKKKEIGPVDWTEHTIDSVTLEGLKIADAEGYSTVFHRALTTTACPIGKGGTCCRICNMGPCRVIPPKGKDETPEERKKRCGLCGATPETIAARNFARMVAAGAAAHSDHGRPWRTRSCTPQRASFLTTKLRTFPNYWQWLWISMLRQKVEKLRT